MFLLGRTVNENNYYFKIVRYFLTFLERLLTIKNNKKKYDIMFKAFNLLTCYPKYVKLYSNKEKVEYFVTPKDSFSFVYYGIDHKRFGISNLYPLFKENIVNPGSIIDIGSSWGEEVKYLSSLVGKEGKLHCFEPNPVQKDILDMNILHNKIDNVKTYNYAVGNKQGKLKVSNRIWAKNTSIEEGDVDSNGYVKVVKLDDLFFNEPISAIKVDTDGFDLDVIYGAMEVIKKYNPLIVVEYLPSLTYSGFKGSDVLREYINLGFKLYPPQYLGKHLEINDLDEYIESFSNRYFCQTHDLVLRRAI